MTMHRRVPFPTRGLRIAVPGQPRPMTVIAVTAHDRIIAVDDVGDEMTFTLDQWQEEHAEGWVALRP